MRTSITTCPSALLKTGRYREAEESSRRAMELRATADFTYLTLAEALGNRARAWTNRLPPFAKR